MSGITKIVLSTLTAYFMMATGSAMAGSIRIDNIWVAAQPDASKTASLFMEITNLGDQDDVLVSVDAPIARFAKPHLTTVKGDKASMRTRKDIVIQAGSTVVLNQGGLHIMLMGLKRSLAPGKMLNMILNFQNGSSVKVNVPIKIMNL